MEQPGAAQGVLTALERVSKFHWSPGLFMCKNRLKPEVIAEKDLPGGCVSSPVFLHSGFHFLSPRCQHRTCENPKVNKQEAARQGPG